MCTLPAHAPNIVEQTMIIEQERVKYTGSRDRVTVNTTTRKAFFRMSGNFPDIHPNNILETELPAPRTVMNNADDCSENPASSPLSGRYVKGTAQTMLKRRWPVTNITKVCDLNRLKSNMSVRETDFSLDFSKKKRLNPKLNYTGSCEKQREIQILRQSGLLSLYEVMVSINAKFLKIQYTYKYTFV